MIVFTENVNLRKRSPKRKDLKTQWCRCCVDGSFSLKMQSFENDATATTSYSNFLNTQTIDFRWFLPFSMVFIIFIEMTGNDMKRIRKRCADEIQSLRFH